MALSTSFSKSLDRTLFLTKLMFNDVAMFLPLLPISWSSRRHWCNFTIDFFFFFYGGSLMDVASETAWRNSPLSSACLPVSTVETPIHSPMSCVHLILGLSLPLLPSHVPSKNSFSNVLCRLMWPKYDSFCFLIRFKSCGAFTPSCSRTLAFVFLSVHEILSIFR